MTGPTTTFQDLERLEKRSEKTYMARLQAANRLATRGRAWNASMLAFSSALLIASIGLLREDNLYGNEGELLLVALSVASLVAGLVVSQLNYPVRARDMEGNYKAIQVVSQLAEADKTFNASVIRHNELLAAYHALLTASENHTSADLWRSKRKGYRHLVCYGDQILTVLPYVSLLVPFYILLPVLNLALVVVEA